MATKNDTKDPEPANALKMLKTTKALKQMRKANAKDRTGEAPEEKLDSSAAITLELKPIQLREYEEIRKDAVVNFKAKEKYNKIKNKGKPVGIKRKIFGPLVDTIVEEETERLRLLGEHRRKLKEELMKAAQEASLSSPEGEKHMSRPSTAPSMGRLTGLSKSRPSSAADLERRRTQASSSRLSSRDNTPIKFGRVVSQLAMDYLNMREDEDPEEGDDGDEEDVDGFDDSFDMSAMKQRFQSKQFANVPRKSMQRLSFVDKKIEIVQKNRERLLAEEQYAIQKRVNDRVEKRVLNAALQHKQALQSSWMLLISQFSRCSIISGIICHDRSERIRWKNASRDKKAVRTIELWWPNTYTLYKLNKKHAWIKGVFAKFFMSKWKRLRVHERYKAQALVIQFVKDVTGLGETVRKVYEFRKKVIRVQRWIKDFFWLKHARLTVLGKALEKEIESLMMVVKQAKQRQIRQARKAISTLKGFGDKARAIDQVSANIENLLEFQSQLENRRKTTNCRNMGRSGTKINQPVIEINVWRAETEATEDGAEKVQFLEMLVKQLRHRHVVSKEAMKQVNVGNGPRANLHDAKIFLNSDSKNSMPKLTETLKFMENPVFRSRKTRAFYMLTGNGGALDRVKEWAQFFVKNKYGEYFFSG